MAKKHHGKENILFIQNIPAAGSLTGKAFLENDGFWKFDLILLDYEPPEEYVWPVYIWL